jgi:O-antigen/teichoic acid export membrane protein
MISSTAGPEAFAPIAASSLLIRPINVLTNALVDFERPRLAAHIAVGDWQAVWQARKLVLRTLLGFWFVTLAGAAIAFSLLPASAWPRNYAPSLLIWACALWLVITLVRVLRTAESAILQGAGWFQPLASCSVVAAPVSVLATFVLVLALGPIWSMMGVLLGEAVYATLIWREMRRWRSNSVGGETRRVGGAD